MPPRPPPPPPFDERPALRALRQSVQRLGLLVKPFIAKNSCSPAVKGNCCPQSTQVSISSVYIKRVNLLGVSNLFSGSDSPGTVVDLADFETWVTRLLYTIRAPASR